MQRSTLALAALATVAIALFVTNPPERSAAPSAPALAAAGGTPGPLPPGAELPPDHPSLDPLAAPAVAPARSVTGRVLETLDSGGYTYARVATDDGDVWVAGPVTTLAVGDEVAMGGTMRMKAFHSASLDRTFDDILFVNTFGIAAAGPPAEGAAAVAGAKGADRPKGAEGGRAMVLEAIHAGGYSYLRIEIDGTGGWLAAPALDVSEGQSVAWDGGALLEHFASPTLGRTFDRILFAQGLRVER